MPSFDIVSEINKVELHNAVDIANKEITTRFDFKGTSAKIELEDKQIVLFADNDFQMKQVNEVLIGKLTKRGVDVRFLNEGKQEKISGGKLKEILTLKSGIEQSEAKKITKLIKDSKIKVQGSIQGESVRVSGKKLDDLQDTMAMLKQDYKELPLEFNNFRN